MKIDESMRKLIPAIPMKSGDVLQAMKAYHRLPETLQQAMLQQAFEQKEKLMSQVVELEEKSGRYDLTNLTARESLAMDQDTTETYHEISEEASNEMSSTLKSMKPLLDFVDYAHKYSGDDYRTAQLRHDYIKQLEREQQQ